MARKPSPWWYTEKNAWYVTIYGNRKRLGDHPAGAPKPKKSERTGQWNVPPSINDAFRRLYGKDRPLDGDAVASIFDDFLEWTQRERAGRTYEWHLKFCNDFAASVSPNGYQYGLINVNELTTKDVNDWLASKSFVDPKDKKAKTRRKPWSAATRKCAITSLTRAFNWAKRNRGLKVSPIEGMEKPTVHRSIVVVPPGEFETLIAAIPTERMSRKDRTKKPFHDPFKDLAIVSYDCGCRPEEIRKIEARHLRPEIQAAVLPKEEAKGKKRARTIFFPTDRSWEIVCRLAAHHTEGPIFRNKHGRPWTASAWNIRLSLLKDAVGRKIKLTEFRKTWITGKILAGTDSHVVAKLSGHASTKMIDEHYSGIADNHQFLLEQAKRGLSATSKDASKSEASSPPSSPEQGRASPGTSQ